MYFPACPVYTEGYLVFYKILDLKLYSIPNLASPSPLEGFSRVPIIIELNGPWLPSLKNQKGIP
jgi:hypothetical protein